MSDEANAASNAASEPVQPVVEQVQQQPTVNDTTAAPTSAREALERAFKSVEGPKPDKPRDEAGRFAKVEGAQPTTNDATKPETVAADPLKPDVKAAEAPKPEVSPEAPKPVAVPAPAGFTKAAQDAWGQTPEPVRADVERRLTELTQGINGYKAQVDPIRPYIEMATASGIKLEDALKSYTGMENLLKQDFVGGVRALCQNMGVNPAQLVAALTGQPAQENAGQPSVEVSQLRQIIQSLQSELGGLKTQVGDFTKTYEERSMAETVERFAATHDFFEDVRPDMANMLLTGFAKDMADAYEKAVRLNPDVLAKVEAKKAASKAPSPTPPQAPTPDPAQTRMKAELSVTGSPPVGSNPSQRKPAGSTREALQNAMAQVGL